MYSVWCLSRGWSLRDRFVDFFVVRGDGGGDDGVVVVVGVGVAAFGICGGGAGGDIGVVVAAWRWR